MNKRWNHFVKDRVLQNTWKKKKAVSVLMVFLIACGLICYTAAVQQKQELLLYQSQVTLFQRNRQFYTYEDAKQMRQRNEEAEEPLSYAIWGTEGMHVLENPVLRRSSMVEIYAVEGNSQLLFPSAVMLNPALTGGCLLGEKAAQELFGVSDASGLTFTMDGHSYQVLGMLEQKTQGAVFLAEDLHTTRLERMTVETSDYMTLSVLEQMVEWKTGFAGTAFDVRFMNSITSLFSVVFCILLWIWLLRLLLGEWKGYRVQYTAQAQYYKDGYRIAPDYIKGTIVRITCITSGVLLMVIFLHSYVKIPEDMIPTKWSDFAFWSGWFADKSERMSDWIRCVKYAPELRYLEQTGKVMVYFLSAGLCYLGIRFCVFVMKRNNKNNEI